MDHSYFKERISGYYDNNLPPYEQQSVEEHLKICEECQKLLAQFEKLDKLVEEKSQLSDTEYWEKSAQKIENAIGVDDSKVVDVSHKSYKGLFWKISAVAASVAILTFIGINQADIAPEAELKINQPPEVQVEKQRDVDNEKVVTEKTKELVETGKDTTSVQPTDNLPEKEKPIQKITLDTVVKKNEAGKGVVEKKSSAIAKSPLPIAVRPQTEEIQIEDEPKIELLSEQLEETIVQPASEPVTISKTSKSAQQFFADRLASTDKESKDNLDYLRKRKDSLRMIYTSYSQTVSKKLKASRSKSASESKIFNDSLRALTEKSLLDTYYKIGLNSDSDIEKSETIRFFENYISRKESFHNELARKYLDKFNK